MKYLPTLNLWNPAIQEAIKSGQIKLQRGQWVQCGSGPKSRYIGLSGGGTLWVVHPDHQQNGKARLSVQWFTENCKAYTGKLIQKN